MSLLVTQYPEVLKSMHGTSIAMIAFRIISIALVTTGFCVLYYRKYMKAEQRENDE